MFLLITVLTLLTLSAFFSGAETAVMSLDRYQIISLADDGNAPAKRLLHYLENPEIFFSIVLLGNTFANISAASLFTLWLVKNLPHVPIWAGTATLSIFVLLFCEMLPKSLATRYPMQISPHIIPFIRLTEISLYPLLLTMQKCMRYLTGKRHQGVNQSPLDAQQLRRVLQAACSHLPKQEQHMLEGVLDLGRIKVEEVMLPKHLVTTINLNDSFEKIKQTIKTHQQNYYVVIEQKPWGKVIGILYLVDLIKLDKGISIESIKESIKMATYVQEGTFLRTQLANFQQNQQEVSLVVNEYGDIIGVLEVHDIVEEVVGHYAQRRAVPLGSVRKDAHQGHWVRADVKIRDLNRYLNWSLPDESGITLGGFILHQLNYIPDGCCALQYDNMIFEIKKIKNNRLILIHIYPDRGTNI